MTGDADSQCGRVPPAAHSLPSLEKNNQRQTASEQHPEQNTRAELTGDLDGPVRPVILLIWFIEIIHKVVLWIIFILSFL